MIQIFSFIQIGIAILLGAAILFQQKGQGLSSAFGGTDGGFYHSKRGFEKVLFIATVILAVLFIVIGITRVIIAPDPTPIPAMPATDLLEEQGQVNMPLNSPIEIAPETVSSDSE